MNKAAVTAVESTELSSVLWDVETGFYRCRITRVVMILGRNLTETYSQASSELLGLLPSPLSALWSYSSPVRFYVVFAIVTVKKLSRLWKSPSFFFRWFPELRVKMKRMRWDVCLFCNFNFCCCKVAWNCCNLHDYLCGKLFLRLSSEGSCRRLRSQSKIFKPELESSFAQTKIPNDHIVRSLATDIVKCSVGCLMQNITM